MPNTIAYVNPDNGEVRGVVGSERRGSCWYGTVWAEGRDTGTSGNFDSETDADVWVRNELGFAATEMQTVRGMGVSGGPVGGGQ